MRTWSVRGTAFALCTRSSSLSIRTSTSMGWKSSFGGRRIGPATRLFSRILGRAGPAVREELLEATGDRLRDEGRDVAAVRGDLLDAARGDEADRRARHHVDGLDIGREVPVQLVHLELPLEVGDHAQPLHDRLGLPPVCELDDELAEDVDLDVVDPADRVTEEGDALVDREHRLLVRGTADDADDDAVEDAGRARDHVDVAVRHRVVRARADRGDHSAASYTVIRTEPYFRLVRSASGSAGSTRASVSTTTT